LTKAYSQMVCLLLLATVAVAATAQEPELGVALAIGGVATFSTEPKKEELPAILNFRAGKSLFAGLNVDVIDMQVDEQSPTQEEDPHFLAYGDETFEVDYRHMTDSQLWKLGRNVKNVSYLSIAPRLPKVITMPERAFRRML